MLGMSTSRRLDHDIQDLLQRLLVVATEMLENAHELVIVGQSSEHSARVLEMQVIRFQGLTENIRYIADAILVIVELHANHSEDKDA